MFQFLVSLLYVKQKLTLYKTKIATLLKIEQKITHDGEDEDEKEEETKIAYNKNKNLKITEAKFHRILQIRDS